MTTHESGPEHPQRDALSVDPNQLLDSKDTPPVFGSRDEIVRRDLKHVALQGDSERRNVGVAGNGVEAIVLR